MQIHNLLFSLVRSLDKISNDDKEKQDQVLRILEVLAGQEILNVSARNILQNLVQTRKMWRANVSFQNALEYLVLQKNLK